jgi:ribosomal-protein-alanine N-acetyltransferase
LGVISGAPSLRTTLQTERLTARPPRSADVGLLLAALRRNEAHLRPWSPLRQGADRRATLATVARDVVVARRSWRRDEAYTFYLFGRAADESAIIGRVTLGRVLRGPFQNSFLGYWLDVAQQRRGLMTEAVAAVVAFAFGTLDLHRVQASIMPRNVSSVRVVEKLGFRHEGVSQNYLHIAGKWEDHAIYALTREDWRET